MLCKLVNQFPSSKTVITQKETYGEKFCKNYFIWLQGTSKRIFHIEISKLIVLAITMLDLYTYCMEDNERNVSSCKTTKKVIFDYNFITLLCHININFQF